MEILILSFSLAVSLFTRLINIGKFQMLTAEVGQHYLEIVKLLEGQFLLQGPLTSHSWLRLSATPYYFFFPLFALFRFHPLTLSYLTTAVDILLPLVNYFIVKKALDRKTAVISTILLSFSPLLLTSGRVPGFYSFVPALSYWLMLLAYRAVTGKMKDAWSVFLVIGLMTTLHAASLMLLPFFLIVFFVYKKFNLKQLVLGLASFSIFQIPFLVKDLSSGFAMTRNLILWIPYKLVNFLTGKTLGLGGLSTEDRTIQEVLAFLRVGILPPQTHWVLGGIVLAIIVGYFLLKKRSLFERILFYWLSGGLLVLTVHKNPPGHYFVPIFTLPVILLSKVLASLMKKRLNKILVMGSVVLLLLINTRFIFSSDFLYSNPQRSPEFVNYKDQAYIVKLLIKDAKGKKYSLSRIGPFDHYQNQFKENYEFLLWREGNRPVEKSNIKYYIVEGQSDKTKSLKKVGGSGKISLYRNQ